jgi:hypothetical protein
MLLSGAAQLITISALLSADPEPATWSMLLLAIAPAPLGAGTAFLPARLVGAVADNDLVGVGCWLFGDHLRVDDQSALDD